MPRRKSKRGSNFEASLSKRGSVDVKHNAGRSRHVQDPGAPRPRKEKQEDKSQRMLPMNTAGTKQPTTTFTTFTFANTPTWYFFKQGSQVIDAAVKKKAAF